MAGNSWGGTTVGTNYRGNRAAAPPNWSFEERNPTQYDSINYVIGDLWLNIITQQVWVLVSLAGNNTSKGELARWIEWGGSPTPPGPTDGFYAYLGASVPNVTGAGVNYTVVFDVEEFDDTGNYDPLTGMYTAPTAGLYSFQSTVSGSNFSVLMGQLNYTFAVAGTGPSVGDVAWFRVNPYVVQDIVGAGLVRANGSTTVRLDAGDTVHVTYAVLGGAGNTAGVSIGSGSPPTRTWFSGCRLGD